MPPHFHKFLVSLFDPSSTSFHKHKVKNTKHAAKDVLLFQVQGGNKLQHLLVTLASIHILLYTFSHSFMTKSSENQFH